MLIKKVLKGEFLDKVIDIKEKILDFNKQQKGKGLKISTFKQMLPRLLLALAPIKAGNKSKNLLTKMIRQIMYFWYQANEITEKVYNYIMNSMQL